MTDSDLVSEWSNEISAIFPFFYETRTVVNIFTGNSLKGTSELSARL